MSSLSIDPGRDDVVRVARLLADRLPAPLRPLAAVAYNYWWTWQTDGPAVFAAIDSARWERCGHNPVRLLREAPVGILRAAAADSSLVAAVERLALGLEAELARPPRTGPIPADHPVAFLCAEFAIHASLPIYSGGLGVLAGDLLKQASDVALPMIGVGLLYRTGYFHQRLDTSGFQHEYWTETDPEGLPCVLVTAPNDQPVRVTVPIQDEDVAVQVWRVDVGRVPLYLLDSDLDENSEVGRWVTSRLYEGNREVRLAQYAVLGVGAPRVLRTLGVEPSVYHLNEGHPALAAVELVGQRLEEGVDSEEAWRRVRSSLLFSTHTPVAAGNETYARSEFERTLGRVTDLTGDRERVLAMGRTEPSDTGAALGLSALALRASRSVNGVSRRHGQVARAMWQGCWPDRAVDDVPVTHVTNGVHTPTWVRDPLRELLDERLGAGWLERADDPRTWEPIGDIPDEELWRRRNDGRRRLIDHVRVRATRDRLRRGEDIGYAQAAQHGLDPEVLTIGFARRVAAYKRIHLLGMDPERAMRLLNGDRPVQLLLAGKAHPQDDGAKRAVQELFHLKGAPGVAGRVVFLEDYDLDLAGELVAGCDLWMNLPRPPLEASGTSGMKAALNGVLNLSVLDGWWAEMYDGTNGWAIDGNVGALMTAARRDGSDGPVVATLEDGRELTADEILVAVGRRPGTGDLGLDRVGLADKAGRYLDVDDQLRVRGADGDWLYAVGDCNGRALLTHMGKYQGRLCADVVLGKDVADVADHGIVPRVTFTDPQVCAVGLTEQQARDQGLDVRTVAYGTGDVPGAYTLGTGVSGTSQLVVDERRRVIVGATFTGPGIQELLHSATIAIAGAVPLDDLWHAVPAFPTISEVWLHLLEAYGL